MLLFKEYFLIITTNLIRFLISLLFYARLCCHRFSPRWRLLFTMLPSSGLIVLLTFESADVPGTFESADVQ